jgi:hypothetical protein
VSLILSTYRSSLTDISRSPNHPLHQPHLVTSSQDNLDLPNISNMPTPSQIDAMVGPQEPPSYASIPSQNMSSARSPRVDSVVKDPMISTVATDLSMTSKISVRQDEAKASTTTALIAAATSGSPVIRKDPLSAPVDIMTHDEVKEAVKQLPEKGPFKLNLQKWQIKPEQYKALERYTKFDHTSEIRSKEDCDPRHVIKYVSNRLLHYVR